MAAAEAARKLGFPFEEDKCSPKDLIEVLQDVQTMYNYLPEEILYEVSDRLGVPLIEVFRVANFYKAFSLEPRGRHHIKICIGTACHVRGAARLVDEIKGDLGISPGETADDQSFSVESVSCVGCCALGPVVVLNEAFESHMNPLKVKKVIKKLTKKDRPLALARAEQTESSELTQAL
ncbi:MAG: NAD(P)H-dependent oxidoreductase subunit E [Proteobacteria bacterium]|nr:NAD(P)H-dependent oxidoreductase subunit E [Pseudomonadota bacterium]